MTKLRLSCHAVLASAGLMTSAFAGCGWAMRAFAAAADVRAGAAGERATICRQRQGDKKITPGVTELPLPESEPLYPPPLRLP